MWPFERQIADVDRLRRITQEPKQRDVETLWSLLKKMETHAFDYEDYTQERILAAAEFYLKENPSKVSQIMQGMLLEYQMKTLHDSADKYIQGASLMPETAVRPAASGLELLKERGYDGSISSLRTVLDDNNGYAGFEPAFYDMQATEAGDDQIDLLLERGASRDERHPQTDKTAIMYVALGIKPAARLRQLVAAGGDINAVCFDDTMHPHGKKTTLDLANNMLEIHKKNNVLLERIDYENTALIGALAYQHLMVNTIKELGGISYSEKMRRDFLNPANSEILSFFKGMLEK